MKKSEVLIDPQEMNKTALKYTAVLGILASFVYVWVYLGNAVGN